MVCSNILKTPESKRQSWKLKYGGNCEYITKPLFEKKPYTTRNPEVYYLRNQGNSENNQREFKDCQEADPPGYGGYRENNGGKET